MLNKNRKTLTDRQIEVRDLILQGFSNKAIAQKLYISPHTAQNHTSEILRKAKAKNRTALIVNECLREFDIDSVDGLSNRQKEVVSLLLKGNMLREIAEKLGVHRSTVRDHLNGVFIKTGTHDLCSLLMRLAGKNG